MSTVWKPLFFLYEGKTVETLGCLFETIYDYTPDMLGFRFQSFGVWPKICIRHENILPHARKKTSGTHLQGLIYFKHF